jgi:hypothetical protein
MTRELDGQEQGFIEGLRELTSFLEKQPDLIPWGGYAAYRGSDNAEEFGDYVRQLGRAFKDRDNIGPCATREFGPHTLQVYAHHEDVCEKVVTFETIEVEEPDPAAVAALPLVKRTEERETVHWECPKSLLALSDNVS